MESRIKIALLNKSCIDILPNCMDWLSHMNVELLVPPELHKMTLQDMHTFAEKAYGIILPSPFSPFPEEDFYRRAENLKFISIAASGHEWFDLETASNNNVIVANSPVMEGAIAVADLTLGLILTMARKLHVCFENARAGNYQRLIGESLRRRRIGIIGLGNIGREVAIRAGAFGMEIIAFDPFPDVEFCEKHLVRLVDLKTLLSASDVVTVHVRLSGETRNMIGRAELSVMKKNVIIVNTARRELCDEPAVIDFLMENINAGYAMDDIPAHEKEKFLKLDNFICTPHIGNRTFAGMSAVFKCAVENIVKFSRKEPVAAILNPEIAEKV